MTADGWRTSVAPEPTPEQIATVDPYRDPLAADAAGVTYVHAGAHIRTVACPRPRCPAGVGEDCRTPNGYVTGYHPERRDRAYGRPAAPKRKPRLTDAQAQRIEIAAVHGQFHAAGQYANYSGDAAERAVADALLRAGLVEVTATDVYGERTLKLTPEGWRTYWHHRLVIRRHPDEQHDTLCPCAATAGRAS